MRTDRPDPRCSTVILYALTKYYVNRRLPRGTRREGRNRENRNQKSAETLETAAARELDAASERYFQAHRSPDFRSRLVRPRVSLGQPSSSVCRGIHEGARYHPDILETLKIE